MKKALISTLALVLASPLANAANLNYHMSQVALQHAQQIAVRNALDGNVLNWTVGDTANYNMQLSLGGIGAGAMVEKVTQDTGDGYWVSETISIAGQNMEEDILFNKADGSIKEVKVNGQDQQIPTDKPTIQSTDYTTVTVPAGTFKVLHVVATMSGKQIEEWVNPQEIVIGGLAQATQPLQGTINVTLQLASQTKGAPAPQQ